MTPENSTEANCRYCGQPIGGAERDRIAEAEARETDELRRKLKSEYESELQKATEAAQARLEAETDEAERQIRAEVEEEFQTRTDQANRAQQRKEQAMEKTISGLQRDLDQRPAAERGVQQEEDLHNSLQRAFPDDQVERVPRGRSGPDVQHTIYADGEKCGMIIYESKNVKTWKNTFPAKLITDQAKYKADYAILVSTVFPAGEDGFCIVGEAPVVRLSEAVPLAHIVRESIITAHGLAASPDETGYKYEELVGYLQSPDFVNQAKRVLTAASTLKDLQDKEKRAHDLVWLKQVDQFSAVEGGMAGIRGQLQHILSGKDGREDPNERRPNAPDRQKGDPVSAHP